VRTSAVVLDGQTGRGLGRLLADTPPESQQGRERDQNEYPDVCAGQPHDC
jgi:hypothetical protein